MGLEHLEQAGGLFCSWRLHMLLRQLPGGSQSFSPVLAEQTEDREVESLAEIRCQSAETPLCARHPGIAMPKPPSKQPRCDLSLFDGLKEGKSHGQGHTCPPATLPLPLGHSFQCFFFFLLAVILSLYPSYHRVSMFRIVFASVCLSVSASLSPEPFCLRLTLCCSSPSLLPPSLFQTPLPLPQSLSLAGLAVPTASSLCRSSSRPSSPSCKNRAFPRGGSSIPNSIRSVAQSFSSRSFNSLWGSGRRAWELLLKGTAPRPPTGPQGPGSALSRPLASLFSTLGQLSHPLLSLSHFFLHDIRLLPGLERGREEQWEGECHLCPLPLSSTRGGSGHRMVST